MITIKDSKEFLSWVTGISVAKEDDASLAKRRAEACGYFERRFQMAKEAAFEYHSLETFTFYEDTHKNLVNFDPESIRGKRWLEVSGYKIPLPSIKT